MSDECLCKKMYCQENNIDESTSVVCDDCNGKGDYILILPERNRVYDFCKCNDMKYLQKIKKIRNDIKRKEICEGKNYPLLKLMCDKMGLNIEDLFNELQ